MSASTRIVSPRRMEGEHEKENFEYPFSATSLERDIDGYSCPIEVRGIPHLSEEVPVGDFPNNIKRWVWSAAGQNDEDPWDGIFEVEEVVTEYDSDEEKEQKTALNAGGPRYIYFHAWCDYTGFDCQGGAFVTVARDIPTLVEYALGRAAYDRYITGTEPAEMW